MFRRQGAGIDLGSSMTRIFVRGRGVVLRELSVVGLNQETVEVVTVGREVASEHATNITEVWPMRDGIVADHGLAGRMLEVFLSRALRSLGQKPDIVLCLPSSLAEAERDAVLGAVREVSREVSLLEEPLAAALGAGVAAAAGVMIVNVGSGTTDIAIVSRNSVRVAETLRVAGDAFDEAIVRAVRRSANLLIGERVAEEVKLELGAALSIQRVGTKTVQGRDLATGTVKSATVRAEEVVEALRDPLRNLVSGVQRVLEAAPPELAAGVLERGVVLTGGGARQRGLDEFLRQQTGLPVTLAENPADCVVLGLGRALDLPDLKNA